MHGRAWRYAVMRVRAHLALRLDKQTVLRVVTGRILAHAQTASVTLNLSEVRDEGGPSRRHGHPVQGEDRGHDACLETGRGRHGGGGG